MTELKKKLFGSVGLKRQMYMIYLVAVVIPILLVGVFLVWNTHRLLVNYHRDLLLADNYRVRSVLFEITTQMYNISEDISFDDKLQNVLSGQYGSREEYVGAMDKVEVIGNYTGSHSEISEINVYTDNPYVEDYKQVIAVKEDVSGAGWYQKAVGQAGVFWKEMSFRDAFGNVYWNLCLVRKIPLINSDYHAVLVIRVSDNYLRTRVDSSEYLNYVSVDEGPVFYSTDRSKYGEKQIVDIDYGEACYQYDGRQRLENGESFVIVSTLHPYQSESRLYTCTVNGQGYENIRYIQWFCIIIIILAILIPGMIIYFYTKRYGIQINEKELMIQQQSMEFKMLASQINPHFLYNTLETIRMKAFTAGDREVATAIKLLGKSMRYVLENTGTSYTSLAEEIAHVENYIQIQKLRFGERINYEKQIEEGVDTGKYKILPLLLQPVVENAIIHGLEDEEREGHIKLAVYHCTTEKGEMLVIDVEDDGEGMTEETLQKLRQDIEIKDMSRSKSIGLYNINQRIKLYYGETSRIQVESRLHRGTTVRLMFPADKMENKK